MDSRETIERLFQGRNVQRMGFKEGIWADTLLNWTKQGYPTTKETIVDDFNVEERYKTFEITEYPIDTVSYFGMDMGRMGFHIDYLPIKGYNEVLEENKEWIIIRDGSGAVIKKWKNKVERRSICILI